MKTQIRQLAKQLQTSSIGFSIATEENPKGHCKAIISTIECDVGGEEEEEVEESTMLEEEMKAQANPSTQGMQSSLNPPLFDFSKLSIHKQGDDERMAKFEKYMVMLQGKKDDLIGLWCLFGILVNFGPCFLIKLALNSIFTLSKIEFYVLVIFNKFLIVFL